SWSLENVTSTAKIWSNGGYIDVQNDLNYDIPAHQGFFVQVTTATGSITIPAAARKHVGTAWQKQNEVPHILMTASANDSGLRQRNVVRKDPANGSDYNAVFLAGNAPQFYAIPDEVPLSTIAPEEITNDTVIPYAFIKNNEGSEFRIALEKTMEDKALYLVDLLADVEHHLTIDEPYIFTSSDDDPAERFELHFASADDPTSVDPPEEATDDARIYVTDGVLYIEFPGAVENAELQLIDALGRKVLNNDLGNGSHFSVPLGLNTGAYIVRLSSSDHLITKKIVIR
ncbi:MAG: T9SS type A sorting domain-containing protein, partial [Bacteroidales bacterium]